MKSGEHWVLDRQLGQAVSIMQRRRIALFLQLGKSGKISPEIGMGFGIEVQPCQQMQMAGSGT